MRPFPPHWPQDIPGLPLLFVFVGAPLCFDHARQQKNHGFTNHVSLSDASDAPRYQWPTRGLMLVVVLFNEYDTSTECALVTALLADEPKELAIRYWPDDKVIEILS